MITWSHLSMKAYEFFLLCEECGAMVHDSPESEAKHVAWHAKIEEQVLYPEKIIATYERGPTSGHDGLPPEPPPEADSAGGVTIVKEPPE